MSETRSKLHEISQASREREAQALRELSSTAVSVPVAAGLVGVVLGLVLTVPLLDAVGRPAIRQAWREFGAQTAVALAEAKRGEWRTANETLRRAMVGIDRRLEEDSWVPAELLPPVRLAVAALGGRPSPDVVPGRPGQQRQERWLFYRPAIDHLTGPPFLDPHWLDAQRRGIDQRPPRPQEAPDPRPAIAEFGAELRARGIDLILVPVPVKAALEATRLTGRSTGQPLSNPSFDELGVFARTHGFAWVELSAQFGAAKARGVPLYLARDTHWRPEAVEIAARAVAERLTPLLQPGGEKWTEEERAVEAGGDLVAMARLPSGQTLFPRETVTVRVARAPTGEVWRRDPLSDVLVLGDSFVNVFSQAELGWGDGGGFAERLSLHLGRAVDRLAQNAGGATASREELERLAAEGDDRLAGKRVVVWVFSARELSVGDWRLSRADSALGDPQ